MAAAVDFHSQIASIMEVLANAAVAEICKVVDDGYSVIHLEMSRSKKENEFLRRKIKLLELQVARYRAERVKGAEGSMGSRFPGIRLNRQSKDPLAEPLLQGRNRFLNRGPGCQPFVQKSLPINLDQDPDQEVVTTTKTESTEPAEKGELLIVKVEGAVETNGTSSESPPDICISTRRGDDSPTTLPTTLKDASDGRPAGHTNETEGLGHLKRTSSPQSLEEKTDEVKGDAPDKRRLSTPSLDHQEGSESQGMEYPSCSTYTLSQTRTNLPPVPRMSQCSIDQESLVSEHDITVINSRTEDSRGDVVGSGPGGSDGGHSSTRPQHQPPICIVISDTPAELAYKGNHISAFNAPPVSMGTVNQQNQNPWTGIGQPDLLESGPGQLQSWQELSCLPFGCTFCSRRYAHQCQLRIHERVHTGERPYQCTQCGKSFGQFCSLKRHQMVHTGERPFPCLHCGKQFSTSTNLKVHQSVHTGEKRFHCSKCGRNFSFLSNLIRHQRVHTGERPYTCPHCGKGFAQPNNLRVHLLIHTGERRYRCTLCGKSFISSSHLKRHRTVHTQEKPYSCSRCGQSFSQMCSVRRHRQQSQCGLRSDHQPPTVAAMSSRLSFQTQLASIMEVLANAAVAEICKLVDDDYAVVSLQMSQCQRENKALKRKLHLLELKMARGNAERRLRESAMNSSRPRIQIHPGDRLREPSPSTGGVFERQIAVALWSGRATAGDTSSPPVHADPIKTKSPDVELVEPEALLVKEEKVEPKMSHLEETEEDVPLIGDDGVMECVRRGVAGQRHNLEQQDIQSQMQSSRTRHSGSGGGGGGGSSGNRGAEEEEPDVVLVKVEEVELVTRPQSQAGLSIQEGLVESSTDDLRGLVPFEEPAQASTNQLPDMQESGGGFSEVSYGRSSLWTNGGGGYCHDNSLPGPSSHCAPLSYLHGTLSGTEPGSSGRGLVGENSAGRGLAVESSRGFHASVPFEQQHPVISLSGELSPVQVSGHTQGGQSSVQKPLVLDPGLGQAKASFSSTALQQKIPRKRVCICRFCGKGFSSPANLESHLRTHTGERPYGCSICGKKFSQFWNLKIHRNIHTGERPYQCSLCPERFSDPSNLKKHQKRHRRRKSYVCRACGKAFSGLSNLEAHERVHTGEKPFRCNTCGKHFSEAGNLKKHQRVHTGEKPFSCDQCGKRFAWICNLRTHQQSATGCGPQARGALGLG
ncbi:uncharacterized protein LOC115047135 [Echeneis naucrates]|uniref:uncharacterized protein LOC115047135 n=1 Tax=Echeneis naucrates TaxID=173247 RepID=UPI001113AB9D|nr:uncharacterized protein LOC115047135 [Echeneis naucrates]